MRDPSSFRDPAGYILKKDNRIIRVINNNYKTDYKVFKESGLYDKLIDTKKIVYLKEINNKIENIVCYKLLEVEKIDIITYPYEWSFSQFKDAALLTLEIQLLSIEHGMKLKDATPYNIQFKNNKPIFIDTLSFECVSENYAWEAYRQFCEMFLGPIYLMSRIDPRISKQLITSINGIQLDLINKYLNFKDFFNPSVFSHLILHNWLSQKKNTKKNFNSNNSKVSKSQHLNIIKQLYSFIESLEILNKKTEWKNYNIETEEEKEGYVIDKRLTLLSFLKDLNFDLTWDIGSNDGLYSRLLADGYSKQVISMDIDWMCVEKNYLYNRANNILNVFPILLDMSNPSPSIGWNNNERTSLYERIGNPDLIVALAIMHHIINDNIPIQLFIDFLKKNSKSYVIIEFVPLDDPKCQEIFQSRIETIRYPSKKQFEELLVKNFKILNSKIINQTNRVLYFLKNK